MTKAPFNICLVDAMPQKEKPVENRKPITQLLLAVWGRN
jgi:hypothetical protein